MVKNSDEPLTKDEIQVLNLLEQHAKESIDEIAKKCGFSRQKAWRIVKHLEERKIIWGYATVTDENAKNLEHFIVLVKTKNVRFKDDIKKEMIFKRIDDPFSDLVKIENIYVTHGICDFVFTFYSINLISAKKFVDKAFQKYFEYIKEYTLIEIMYPLRKQGLKNPQINKLVEYE